MKISVTRYGEVDEAVFLSLTSKLLSLLVNAEVSRLVGSEFGSVKGPELISSIERSVGCDGLHGEGERVWIPLLDSSAEKQLSFVATLGQNSATVLSGLFSVQSLLFSRIANAVIGRMQFMKNAKDRARRILIGPALQDSSQLKPRTGKWISLSSKMQYEMGTIATLCWAFGSHWIYVSRNNEIAPASGQS